MGKLRSLRRSGAPALASAERTCGDCTACCIVLDVPDRGDGFVKPANVACSNCVAGSGCAIYEGRPQVCRTFKCLWLTSDGYMDDAMRPDRSGLIVTGPPPSGFPPRTMWGAPVLIAHETTSGAAHSSSAQAVLSLLVANGAVVLVREQTQGDTRSVFIRAPSDDLTRKVASALAASVER